ncbi:M48 family metalloprotease [Nocardiopsis alborubida]|uniref:M48 family metalloprotease n=1 Tax=Nocardiopsis alborubida TaxID=146802 RepID=UPI000A474CD0|nr:M48 family metalloprotease [Nocardiopsis alborubida]
MYCDQCGTRLPAVANSCTACGAAPPPSAPRTRSRSASRRAASRTVDDAPAPPWSLTRSSPESPGEGATREPGGDTGGYTGLSHVAESGPDPVSRSGSSHRVDPDSGPAPEPPRLRRSTPGPAGPRPRTVSAPEEGLTGRPRTERARAERTGDGRSATLRDAPRPAGRGPARLRDNAAGNAVALLAAWFNLPLAVFLTAVGTVFGAVGGLVSGTFAGAGVLRQLNTVFAWILPLPVSMDDLLPTAAVQIGGTVGALLGAVSGGATMAFHVLVSPWLLLWEADPAWPFALAVGQVVTALAVASAYVAYCGAAEPARLRVSGARRPSRREAELLEPVVARAAARMGLDRPPKLLVDDSREPNAYAGIRHIVVNRGLLDVLGHDADAVAGVIAHEVAHHKHGDAVSLAWNRGIAWPVFLVHELAHRAQVSAVYWTFLLALVRVLLWSVTVTVRLLVMPVNARHWRRAELRADAEARAAGYGPGLYTALARLGEGFDGARSGWDAAVLATHPPTELRLERLETPGAHHPLHRTGAPLTSGLRSQLLKD